jgi:CHU_C Type IX secretion signal domain
MYTMNKKDELIDLLRERLGDLEATVDPGLWQGIQGRMAEAAVANGTDPVTELFRSGLEGAEAPVDPGVWTNISSQLGHPAVAGGSIASWVGAGLAAAVVAGGLWLGLSGSDPVPAKVVEALPAVEAPVLEAPTGEEPGVAHPSNSVVEKEAPIVREPIQVSPSSTAEVLPIKAAKEGAVIPEPVPQLEPSGSEAGDAEKEVPGPFLNTVNAIIGKAENEIAADPQPKEEGDDRVPAPQQNEPTEEEAEVIDAFPSGVVVETSPLFIPNVFTPNNDGVNDDLKVIASGLTNVLVSIYSAANNKLVYRANSLAPWDGRDPDGVPCTEGYYFYAIEAIGPDGKSMSKGKVVLLNIR